jgi:hypothetical protein
MIFTIFSANVSDNEPPKTVKSWEYVDETPVYLAVAGDDAVELLRLQPEIGGAVHDEPVQLDEEPSSRRSSSRSRRQFPFRVAPGPGLTAACWFGARRRPGTRACLTLSLKRSPNAPGPLL